MQPSPKKRVNKRKQKPFVLPNQFEVLESYISSHKIELMEFIVDAIEHANKNDIPQIEVIKFENSDYIVSIDTTEYLMNIQHIYDSYLKMEKYEKCERVYNLINKLKNA